MQPDSGSRYRAISELGRGAQGAVWVAEDMLLPGRRVALKLLAARPEHIVCSQREFALLARLRHPSLATVFDSGINRKGQPFIVSELVEGVPFGTWRAGRSIDESLNIIGQLLGVLDFLHRRRLIHRDVKPDNVLVVERRIKLVDFGLAVSVGSAPELSGTLAYLAPELLHGDPPSAQSDLYAVGVMLHEILWHRLPHPAGYRLRDDHERFQRGPEDAVSLGLRQLVEQLLAPDPRRRPTAAADVLYLLEDLVPHAVPSANRIIAEYGLPQPELVGRRAVLERAALEIARFKDQQQVSGLLIVGEQGCGRSRLAEEISIRAQEQGLQICRGWPAQASATSIPKTQEEGADPLADRAAAVQRMVETVSQRASTPLLLLLDDPSSALALQMVSALLQREKLRVLICATALSGTEAERMLSAQCSRLEVGALDPPQIAELLPSMVPQAWLSSEAAQVIYQLSGGNPALIIQIVQSAVDPQTGLRGPLQLAKLLQAEERPSQIEDIVEQRIKTLSPSLRRLLATLALFPHGLSRHWLDAFFPALEATTIDSLFLQGLINEPEPGMVQLTALPLGMALRHTMPVEERRHSGSSILSYLAEQGCPVVMRALVAARSQLTAEQRSLVLEGARAAQASCDYRASIELYGAALDAGAQSTREKRTLQEELVALYFITGQNQAAIALLRRLAEETTAAQRVYALCTLADAQLCAGLTEHAWATLEQAGPSAVDSPDETGKDGSPPLSVQRRPAAPAPSMDQQAREALLTQQAKVLVFSGRYKEALERSRMVIRVAPARTAHDPDPRQEGSAHSRIHGEALHYLGLAHYYLGHLEDAAYALDQAVQLLAQDATRDDGKRERTHHRSNTSSRFLSQTKAQNSRALVFQRQSDFIGARRAYEQCLTWAREMRHLPLSATFLMNLGSVHEQQGNLGQALRYYEESLEVARSFGGLREIAQVLHNHGRLLANLGQQAQASASLQSCRTLCTALPWVSLDAHNALVEGEMALEGGLLAEAEKQLSQAAALFTQLDDRRGMLETMHGRVKWLLQQERIPEARTLAQQLLEQATDMTSLLLRAHLVMASIALREDGDTDGQSAEKSARALSRSAPPAASGARVALRHLSTARRLAEDSGEREVLVEIHQQLYQAYTALNENQQAALQLAIARLLLEQQLAQLPPLLHPAFLSRPWRQQLLATGASPGEGEAQQELDVRGVAAGSAVLAANEARAHTLSSSTNSPLPAAHQPSDLLSLASTHSYRAAMGSLSAPPADGGSTSRELALLGVLVQINKELNEEQDLKRLLERIIDHAVDLAGAERGFLLLLRERQLEVQVARNIDQETIRRKEFKISRSIAEEVLHSGQPLVAMDAMGDDRFSEFLSVHHLKLRSVLCVPLTIRREIRGAIYLDHRWQRQAFGARHIELLSALAVQAAIAISNRELLEALHQRQLELERKQHELEQANAQLQQALAQQNAQLDELTQLTRAQKGELQAKYRFENLIGQSQVMREIFGLMDRVKDTAASLFIYGESGTGKELVAKAIHYSGTWKEGPFISTNCGAIPASLLESELFGYEKGAFTGAHKQHKGLFERSNQGTLFLDEVADMPPELQVKLLRVLQEKRFTRIGGEVELQSEFRLVSASNKDLRELVEQGQFREDLFFRINVITLRLPPLRQRREDIPLLIEFFLAKHDAQEITLSKGALALLMDYAWPGNVRELENEIMRLLALAGPVVSAEDLSSRMQQRARAPRPSASAAAYRTLKDAVQEFELHMVKEALRECRGSVTDTAKRLGMTRVGLHKLLKRLGIDRGGVL